MDDLIAFLFLKPDPGGQDRLDRVVKGAKVSFAQKRRSVQHPLVKQRPLLQRFQNRLQLALVSLRQRQNDTLTALIGASEGDADPQTDRNIQAVGHAVVIGLVDGIDRSGNGNFCDHRQPSSRLQAA